MAEGCGPDACNSTAKRMAARGHQRRVHGAGAVSGPPPIATDRRAAIRVAVRSNGRQPAARTAKKEQAAPAPLTNCRLMQCKIADHRRVLIISRLSIEAYRPAPCGSNALIWIIARTHNHLQDYQSPLRSRRWSSGRTATGSPLGPAPCSRPCWRGPSRALGTPLAQPGWPGGELAVDDEVVRQF
jgi:hypothetical protein